MSEGITVDGRIGYDQCGSCEAYAGDIHKRYCAVANGIERDSLRSQVLTLTQSLKEAESALSEAKAREAKLVEAFEKARLWIMDYRKALCEHQCDGKGDKSFNWAELLLRYGANGCELFEALPPSSSPSEQEKPCSAWCESKKKLGANPCSKCAPSKPGKEE